MRRHRLGAVALTAVLVLGACGDDSSSGSAATNAAPAAAASTPAATSGDVPQAGYGIPADLTQPAAGGTSGGLGAVTAENVAFNPAEITVSVGDTLTFTNGDGFAHTFTADNGEFDSENVDGGGSFEYTADAAGEIAYHCNIHSTMKGTISVEA